MFLCLLSLLINRYCDKIAAFGVRFLAAFLLAFLLGSFGFVALLSPDQFWGFCCLLGAQGRRLC